MREKERNMKTSMGSIWRKGGREREKLAGSDRGNIRRREEGEGMDEENERVKRKNREGERRRREDEDRNGRARRK